MCRNLPLQTNSLENPVYSKLHLLILLKGKANEIDLDPALKKVMDLRQWFEKRLDDAIQAAEKEDPKPVKSLEEGDTAK